MSKKKWGESFLKSGLPLEHLTIVTFRSLDWNCRPRVEYTRENRNGEKTWFEIDLEASSYETNKDTSLSFLVECKYHDLNRFWFFLPHDSERWAFNRKSHVLSLEFLERTHQKKGFAKKLPGG